MSSSPNRTATHAVGVVTDHKHLNIVNANLYSHSPIRQNNKSERKNQTHGEQPALYPDNVWDLKTRPAAVPVGAVELEADAEVAGDDDERGENQVEAHYGNDEGEAVVLHPLPGQGAGQAEGFGAIPAPADDGEQGPGEGVQPYPRTQDLHRPSADPYRNDTKRSPFHARLVQ